MEKYGTLEKVGEGSYGKVYKAFNKISGKVVALKKVRFDEEEGVPSVVIREISLLKVLSQSLYIVRLLDVETLCNDRGKHALYMVFEYVDSDLRKYIDTHRSSGTRLSTRSIQSFMYQLCKGIAYCHSNGVLHRDLKPQNILVDPKNGVLKIADLGLGRAFTVPIKSYTPEIVTLWYRAPEVLLGTTHYSTAVDIWSLGCIFAVLCNMQALFRGDSQLHQLLKIFRLLGTPDEHIWQGVTRLSAWHEYPQWKSQEFCQFVTNLGTNGLDLLSKMLHYDPAKRISAKEALDHPYFDDLDRSQF